MQSVSQNPHQRLKKLNDSRLELLEYSFRGECPEHVRSSILEIWAFVSRDAEGNEGICGFQSREGTFMPMVCADQERVQSLKPIALHISTQTKQRIHLVKFSVRTEIEEIRKESLQ
jgi:hypothetical protein